MSRKIQEITISEFKLLISQAQKIHSHQRETIPQMNDGNKDNIVSCLNTPFQKFGGVHFYKGFARKAAVLFYSLIKNHPLVDGNKRMACFTLGYFVLKNNFLLKVHMDEFYDIAKFVAESDPVNRPDVLNRLTKLFKGVTEKDN